MTLLEWKHEHHKATISGVLKKMHRICRTCIKLGVAFIIENPRTSRLWLTDAVAALISSHR